MSQRAHSSGPDRYTILGAIHRGGMGEILLARVEGADGFTRKLVLKGLLPELAGDTVSHELFRREAQIMGRLEHPNIVRVLDFAYVDDKPYLAMEYVRGRNFHQLIQRSNLRRERVPVRVAAYIVAEALRGLHYAHRARDEKGIPLGIIHRDVSPGNILVSFFGEVKVTDFGIAKASGAKNVTGPRSVRGKARYVAPEIIRGESASVQSDIHAAGVVLAEALLGEPLWEKKVVSETLLSIISEPRNDTIARIFRSVDEVPGLSAALRGALAVAPSDRFSSSLQFAETLDAVCRASGGPLTHAELGAFLRRLFHDAPDLPADERGAQPDKGIRDVSFGSFPPPNYCEDVKTDPSVAIPIDLDPVQIASGLRSAAAPLELEAISIRSSEAVAAQLPPTAPLPIPDLRDTLPPPVESIPPLMEVSESSASYFSELLDLPRGTDQESSRSVPDQALDEITGEGGWRAFFKRPWVLVMLGILIGAGAALTGSLLALSR